MLGLIKKDFLLIKSNLKSMIIIFVIYIMLTIQGTFDIAMIMPFIGIMLFISTFSYDDFNNWNSYAVTLPNGRKNVVKAKYIASILFTILLAILSLILSITISYIRTNNIDFNETMITLLGSLASSFIIISLLYPIMFKFGATNGRIILFVLIFGIVGLGTLIMQFVDMSNFINTIDSLGNWLMILIMIIFVIILGISYLISNRIYKNKEY